ncbi:MAG: hypothetical protein KGM97_10860 [Alphaproteobacteria bacterium]|nr:hypothetical protein [Alphaproteobacteria bacterium]MDE2631475.1 hypothetical protein [Alphaproteobacteria bacterium]
MRALKLLVIVLGVLLLAGIGALATAVIWRINHAAAPSAARPAAPFVRRIALPPGAKVIGTDVEGGHLVVRVDMPNGGVRVLVLDLATGAPIATIEVAPTSP